MKEYKCQTSQGIAEHCITDNITVEDYGCLIVSLYNVYSEYTNFISNGKLTPSFEFFLNFLKENKSFTNNGLLIWKKAEELLKFKHYFLSPKNAVINNHHYKFWIAEISHPVDSKLSHFMNIIGSKGSILTCFDVFDGKIKIINKNNCKSIREVQFGK